MDSSLELLPPNQEPNPHSLGNQKTKAKEIPSIDIRPNSTHANLQGLEDSTIFTRNSSPLPSISSSAVPLKYRFRQSSSSAETPTSQSHSYLHSVLPVCHDCQHELQKAFDHCISQFTSGLPSVRVINEEQDAQRKEEPPDYDIIDTPELDSKNKIFVDPREKLTHEMIAKAKVDQSRSRSSSYNPESGSCEKRPGVFQGMLYKQVLFSKNKEIEKLRFQLSEKSAAEQREIGNVAKLQRVLKKSLEYYSNAADWQTRESNQLVEDIKFLKKEISTLIAVIINAENDRQKVLAQIRDSEDTIRQRDNYIHSLKDETQSLKDKLHQSFKDYLKMNETVVALQKEAHEGSIIVKNKNHMLQSNLDRLSKDFDATSRKLIVSEERVRQLEFELKELVVQFNETGDQKRNLELKYRDKEQDLQQLKHNNAELQKSYDESSQKCSDLERSLHSFKLQHEQMCYNLEGRIVTLTKTLEEVTATKICLDGSLSQYKEENDKFRQVIVELQFKKEDLGEKLQNLQARYDSAVTHRDSRIEELEKQIDGMEKELATTKEAKERVLFKVTDLRNGLDRESARAMQLEVDLKQFKKLAAEEKSNLMEQIESLTKAKGDLTRDKRELMENLKAGRKDYLKKETELVDLKDRFEQFQKAKADEINGLHGTIVKVTDNLKNTTDRLNQLLAKHGELTSTHENMIQEHQLAVNQISSLQNDIRRLELIISDLQSEKIALQEDKSTLVARTVTLSDTMSRLNNKIEELKESRVQTELRHKTAINQKDSSIQQLNEKLAALENQLQKLQADHNNLKISHRGLQQTLKTTQNTLLEETTCRSVIEMSMGDLRRRHDVERKSRIEFERMHLKLGGKMEEFLLRTNERAERKTLWAAVERNVGKELSNLNDVISILSLDKKPKETKS